MQDFEINDEYQEPIEIETFCIGMMEAWRTMPEATFGEFLEAVFNGHEYSGSNEEVQELLNEFILQNG